MVTQVLAVDTERQANLFNGIYIVIVCMCLYLFSQVDRQIINLVTAPVQREFGVGDFDMSVLMGPSFGVSYALTGLAWARLSDRWSRRGTIFIGTTIWAFAACACGFAHTYFQFVVSRVLVGAGEAALLPSAFVLVAQAFRGRGLATALSVMSMGSVGGMALAFGLGGWLMQIATTWPYVVAHHIEPWRVLFVISGAPCLVLPLLIFGAKEERGVHLKGSSNRAPPELFFAWARANAKAATGILVSFGLVSMCSSALVSWTPTYMTRSLGWNIAQAGALFGTLIFLASTAGKVGSGLFVDWLFRRGFADAHIRYLFCAALIAGPAALIAFTTTSHVLFVAGLTIYLMLGVPIIGYGSALIQIVTPPHLRAQASAWFLLVLNFFAVTLGPTIVGLLSEHVFRSPQSLGKSISLVVALSVPTIVIVSVRSLASVRAAVTRTTAIS